MQARVQVPLQTQFGALPESEFVAATRDSIPQPPVRLTTATTRGRGGMRGRGRGRKQTSQAPIAPQVPGKGNRRGRKRASEATTSQAEANAQQPPGDRKSVV